MSEKLWNVSLTNDIVLGLYQSENKDDGSWWSYQGKNLRYFDFFSEKRIVENLKTFIMVFVVGQYFISIVRFKNK